MSQTNRQFLLAKRPVGAATRETFSYVETPVGEPGPNQILVIPEVVCCTAWQRTGHDTWLPGMRSVRSREPVGPWKYLDSEALHPSTGTGAAWLTWEDGWTALGIDDRTVDSRPGSHATFAMEGEYGFTEALAYARHHFPEVVARIEQRAEIRLVPR